MGDNSNTLDGLMGGSGPLSSPRLISKDGQLAPTKDYEDTIVVPTITADNFELKHGLFTLVQNKQFFGHEKEDPHVHVRYFNKITSTLKFPNVLNTSIKLMLFPFSLEGAARIWLEKEPPRSIFTWDDLVSKFINQFFPPSKTTNLRNAITNFQQRFDESFSEAWDIFKDLLRTCPHHGFSELHQLDTFYNALNSKDQDSLNSAVGDMVKALLLDKKGQNQSPALVKAVEESCVTCGGQNMQNQLTNLTDLLTKFVNSNSASTLSSGTLPSNTIANPRSDLKAITTRSGVSYDGPQIPPSTSFLPKVVENEPEATKDIVNPTNNKNTKDVQPQVVQSKSPILTSKPVTSPISEPVIASVSASNPDLKTLIPYPSRRNDERNREKANNQIEKFYQIFKDMKKLSEMARTLLNEHCSAVLLKKLPEILEDPGKFLIPCDFPGMAECLALTDLGASINLMPFSVWKRFSHLTPTCMILELADRLISRSVGVAKYVYVKVGSFHFLADFVVVDFDADPRVPLILGRSFLKTRRALIDVFEDFDADPRVPLILGRSFLKTRRALIDVFEALADLGASINLMPFSVWKRLSLPDLTPTCMTLELVDRSISHLVGVAKDVYVNVGELTLRIGKEAITFNLDQTSRYSTNYSDMTTKRIDIIDMACEEYSQGVLGFFDVIASGNPTSFYDLIVSTTSSTLTLFENSDFLLEEVDAFLAIEDDPNSLEFFQPYLDPEGDILLLEAFLNDDLSLPPPNQENYLPEVHKELKIYEAKSYKSSVDEPKEVELKDLPPNLEYAFLEGDDKLPVIIAKDFRVEERRLLSKWF
nr:reverse transcriptase domain-containing protein [Tanacetum cinerariifolium]